MSQIYPKYCRTERNARFEKEKEERHLNQQAKEAAKAASKAAEESNKQEVKRSVMFNPYSAEIFLYKPWRLMGFVQFECLRSGISF